MTTDRAGYIAGLRALADLLEQHEEIPLPYTGRDKGFGELLWILHGDDQRDVLAALARALPGTVQKGVRDDAFDLIGCLHGFHVRAIAQRAQVCERVVKGTREVTREVTIPVETRTETVTETVEDVEWVCAPLTAPVPA